MIRSYGDEATRDLHYAENTKKARRIPKELWPVARRKLNRLHLATQIVDLMSPGNNVERLKGKLTGFYSIRINDQWRVVFKFEAGAAYDVKVVDYH